MHSDDKSHPGYRKLKAVAATAAAVASLVALSAVPAQAEQRRHRRLGVQRPQGPREAGPRQGDRPVRRPPQGRQGDQGGQPHPQQALQVGRRARQLERQWIRLLRLRQLCAPRRPPAPHPDGLGRPHALGSRRQGPLDHRLQQLGPRVHGRGRAAIRHLDDGGQRARLEQETSTPSAWATSASATSRVTKTTE